MTVNHQQQLVIDLTHTQIDEEYLETLCEEVKTNTNIGYIIWGARNEKKLNGNHLLTQVEETIKLNNTRYERFPSDYTHCLLANHCRQSSIITDGKLLKKLENLGWKVEVTFKEEKKRYVSILYKNEAKKQLVLAFRGAKMEVKDIFVDDEQLDGRLQETIGRLVSHQSCNAYQHAKAAFEMSQELGYSISFTGYSYGSWLAEKCVYFCFREFSTLDIRAVTFESPGSLDMIQLLVQSNLLGTNHFSQSPSHNLNDLDKLLDVRTYLFSPNFINTYNSHFGKVYRLYEADSDSKAAKLIDEFMMEKFLPLIPDHSTRETFHKWYDTIRNDGLINKYSFFLNGLRHLLVDDLDWILAELESNSKRKEVLVWPKLNFTSPMSNLDNIEINTAQFLVDFILFGNSIPENVRKLVLRPIDWVVSNGLRAITRNQLSGIAIIFNLLLEIKNGNLGENQCLACFEYYDKIFEHPESLVIMYDKPDMKVTYQAEYRVRQIDPFSDRLTQLPPHIDRKLVEFYFDLNDDVYFNSPVREQFDELKKLFAVTEEWNGKMFVGHVRSLHLQHNQIEVDRVRDRFMRLFRITEEYFEHLKKQRRMTIQNDYVVTDCIGDVEKQVYLKFEENLFENMDGLLATNKFLYIFGESGFGKTTLAREFAYYYKKRHHSSDCLLVQFITSESFSSNLLELEKRLFGHNNTLVKEEDLIKILKSKVNSLNRKILFIFDRVENLDEVDKILETIDDQKFIITTKNDRLLEKYDPKGRYGVKVNAFDEKLCLEYMRLNGIVRKDWPDIMRRRTSTLVAPKDMEIVCDNLRLKPHLTTKDVEELLKKETRYKVLYNENKLSYEILKHLAYLDGTEIDCELIKEIFMDRGGGELKSSLDHLTKSGYLKKHVRGGEVSFEMHECTQSDMKEILNEDISDKNDVLTRLVYIFNSQKSNDLSELAKETRCEKLNRLKKNVRNLVKETWKEKNHDANYVSLLNKIALYNRKIAKNLENAKTAERNILEVRRNTLPENHIDIGMSLYNIGSIYDEQKNFNMALQYYNKALDIFKKQLPENHPDIAQLLHDIGSLYEDQKSYQEALAYYKQSLEYFKQTLPKNHPSIAESKKYIGNLYRKQKEFDKALEYYEKSLEILKQILPENHLKIASLLDDIGLTYSEEGEYKEALESYQLSLDIKKQKLTPLHPSIAASMDKIGLAYLEQGNYDKALEYYKKSLEIKNKSLPANHPSIAGSIKSIGLAFYEHGDYDKALDYYKKVLEIENLTLPAVHLDRAETLHNIGQVYKSQGKYDKALEYFNESLEIKKNLLPSYHPNIAKSLENIGIVYSNQGKYHTALEYYNKSLEMKRLTLDSNHPDIAQSLHNIGIVYRNQGNYTEALSYYKRALDLKLETLPPNHPGIAKSLENIGIVYRNLKEFDLSLEYYTKSLEIKKQTLPVNHPEIGQSMNNIGLVYADIGSLDSALEFYRKALEIFNQKLPPSHPYIATVSNNIKMVEQKMGDHLQSRF